MSSVCTACSRPYGFSHFIMLMLGARITHSLKVTALHGEDTETNTDIGRGTEGGRWKSGINYPSAPLLFGLISASIAPLLLHLSSPFPNPPLAKKNLTLQTLSSRVVSSSRIWWNQQEDKFDSLWWRNCAGTWLLVSSNLAPPTQTHGALQSGS